LFAYLLAIAGGFMAIPGPNIRAVLMDINESQARGTVFSALTLFDDLGKGFGPMVIVFLITLFGRRVAFTLTYLLWIVSGTLIYQLRFHLTRDYHNQNIIPGFRRAF